MQTNQILKLHVKPQAKVSAFAGQYGERLKVNLAAPATDNRANEELIDFLSRHFKVPKKNIVIKSGLKSRDKTVIITPTKSESPCAR